MKKFAIGALAALFSLLALAASAQSYPPTALTFIGYGQSTMQAPGTTFLYETCQFSTTGGGQVTISGITGPLSTAGLGAITGGSGGTDGTYANVPLTGGSGANAKATITVFGGAVTAVAITTAGNGFGIGNSLSAASGNIGNVAGFSVVVNYITSTPIIAGAPGSAISAAGIAPGSNPMTTAFVSGTNGGPNGSNGVYATNVSIALGPLTCAIATETIFMTSLTGSNINSNAFMIYPKANVTPLLGPRGMWETLDPATNCTNSKPLSTAYWFGFTPLKELAYATNCGNGGFYIETPMSSFVAQYIAMTGWAAPNAIVAENMSHGGQDWTASLPNILAPGGNNDWANLVTAQKYIKNAVQSSSSALPGLTGPWAYRLGGVPLRLGESAAAAASATVGATPPSTTAATFLVTTSPQTLNGVSQSVAGWCVYDATTSAFLGYATSWASTMITLQANSLASGAVSDTIYLSPCYPGYLAELKSMVAQFTASDVSDAPDPAGVPIFAPAPSSSNWGSNQKFFQFVVDAAMVTEALADRRFVATGPSFVGTYQSDSVHQEPQGNAIVGAYMGKWASWYRAGIRTPPFAMIQATRLTPSQMDGTHYGVRVTFQMPPSQPCVAPGANGMSCASNVTAAQQQALQFFTDSNIPSFYLGGTTSGTKSYGFCYTDGAYPAGGSTFFNYCAASASTITIASAPILSVNNTNLPGAANQIDIPLSGDPNTATNPTVSLGAQAQGNGVTIWGAANVHLFAHNVANKDCTVVANAGLSGNAYANPLCGSGSNYLIDFASPSFIGVGQTLTPAW
ncbi:hypothetical protein [Methylocystis bryophila]|uniref:Sialate O-acetylesterase domain-containing protein n=1 Tax=Methylocystis bryophila TaxID=655015 RepID=A0A1W6MXB3_9HYPH|nr:hypothetical protein [Methylocystis bryophila]ARN82159.1 hypothetical protein B1812_14910 [Methylocystis bryophila]BDV38291.1 hypothetical protein DSM21852_15440 [Methylocystis bryophila]